MSYVLINGKRYYKDDRTGETTRDNVSQAVADHNADNNSFPSSSGMRCTVAVDFCTASTRHLLIFPGSLICHCL